MDWTTPRELVCLSTQDLNSLSNSINTKNPNLKKIRDETLKKYNFSCRFCGGKYSKYLICSNINLEPTSNKNSENSTDCCCKLC